MKPDNSSKYSNMRLGANRNVKGKPNGKLGRKVHGYQPQLSENGPPIVVKKEPCVCIYVDGACQPNPGKGGYAFTVVEKDEVLYEYNRMVEETTNNRMEMSAIIDALQWVLVECPGEKVVIYTDSEYCHKGITKWHYGWEKKKWEGVKNPELWQEMVRLKDMCPQVQYVWVRGHSGNKWNEYTDRLAVEAITGKREEDKPRRNIKIGPDPWEVNGKLPYEDDIKQQLVEANQLLLGVYNAWKINHQSRLPVHHLKIEEYLQNKQLI